MWDIFFLKTKSEPYVSLSCFNRKGKSYTFSSSRDLRMHMTRYFVVFLLGENVQNAHDSVFVVYIMGNMFRRVKQVPE